MAISFAVPAPVLILFVLNRLPLELRSQRGLAPVIPAG
jgi:hypothetical protein